MRSLLVVLLAAFSFPALAHEWDFPEDYTRLLVPVTAINVPGANGSLWTTEWTIYNATDDRLYAVGAFPFLFLSPPVQDNEVKVGETRRLAFDLARPGLDGGFVYLPTAHLDDLPMSLRVRDISVNAQSYGTSIPIVPVSDFKPRVRLIDIPTDAAYRTMLRVYSASDRPQVVRVTVFAAGGTQLERYDLLLRGADHPGIDEILVPAYVQFDPLSAAVRASGAKVRVEVETLRAEPAAPPIWAFVSISHNATQQVTTVVP